MDNDEWDEDWSYEREPGIETACMDCGDVDSGDACQCCGGALCFRCSEVSAGFCDECLKDPDFSKKMAEKMEELAS